MDSLSSNLLHGTDASDTRLMTKIEVQSMPKLLRKKDRRRPLKLRESDHENFGSMVPTTIND